MTLQVKLGNQTTQHVNIQQGIRQGPKLSTLLYKRYNNTILNAITGSHLELGAKIGTICVASPTCADDIALLENPTENPHNIWKAARNNQNDIRKAEFKSRLITRTYMLQTTKTKFSKNQISGICELCTKAEEDIKHFLLECESLESVRLKQMNKLLSLTELKGGGDKAPHKEEDVLQIIMDCSKPSTTSLSHLKANDLIEIEKQSQNFCHQMHKERTKMKTR
ncbi:unnamed protein product [Mytilus edulis]|uniref:Reverse transcriptase zinc-binding domain-containing protein n=1 Tax=Mytilus edulis TaxID=6550 RepID=A0A8S3R3W5_MYTED|nr:unnamed protein product [Mytilus edulis]